MMAPTSVSSRFSASPVTPLPKSSISLSMASVRPSILATPSPISRTAPTFCLATEVFTPAIRDSISCSKLLIKFVGPRAMGLGSETLRQFRQPRADAAVINVAADLHAQAPDQLRGLREGEIQTGTVAARQIGLHAGPQVFRELNGAFDFRSAARQVQLHQPVEMRQDGEVTARPLRDELLHRLARAVFV